MTNSPDSLQFFSFGHLKPGPLADTSKLFAELAAKLAEQLPDNSMGHKAFEKLLEAKDCAVRSVLSADPR